MTLPSFLAGRLWKIATGAAGVICLTLAALLMSSYFENRSIARQNAELARRINDPKTGYIAQLAQSHTNEATLKVQVAEQNLTITKLSAESTARLKAAEARVAAANAARLIAERKVAAFLATAPQGATLGDRFRDIDARILKDLTP